MKPAVQPERTNLLGAPLFVGGQIRQVRPVPLAGVNDVHASLARRRKHAAACQESGAQVDTTQQVSGSSAHGCSTVCGLGRMFVGGCMLKVAKPAAAPDGYDGLPNQR